MSIPCTVTILTLNSGKTLERCLTSVKDCAEILIVDGNSIDNTREVAQKFGARVEKQYDTDEPNVRAKDFSELRRKSFGLATYPWVFYIDSDESASPDLMRGIAMAVAKNDSRTAYAFSRIAVIDGHARRYAFHYPDWCVRLWHKNSGVHFKQNKIVHEQIAVPENITVQHLPGDVYAEWPDLVSFKRKDAFYVSLFAQKIFTAGTTYSIWRELRAVVKNIAQACVIVLKIVLLHATRPSHETVPVEYEHVFAIHHLKIAGLRLRRLLGLTR